MAVLHRSRGNLGQVCASLSSPDLLICECDEDNRSRPSAGSLGLGPLWTGGSGFSAESSSLQPHPLHGHRNKLLHSKPQKKKQEGQSESRPTDTFRHVGCDPEDHLEEVSWLWSGAVRTHMNQNPPHFVHAASSSSPEEEPLTRSVTAARPQLSQREGLDLFQSTNRETQPRKAREDSFLFTRSAVRSSDDVPGPLPSSLCDVIQLLLFHCVSVRICWTQLLS